MLNLFVCKISAKMKTHNLIKMLREDKESLKQAQIILAKYNEIESFTISREEILYNRFNSLMGIIHVTDVSNVRDEGNGEVEHVDERNRNGEEVEQVDEGNRNGEEVEHVDEGNRNGEEVEHVDEGIRNGEEVGHVDERNRNGEEVGHVKGNSIEAIMVESEVGFYDIISNKRNNTEINEGPAIKKMRTDFGVADNTILLNETINAIAFDHNNIGGQSMDFNTLMEFDFGSSNALDNYLFSDEEIRNFLANDVSSVDETELTQNIVQSSSLLKEILTIQHPKFSYIPNDALEEYFLNILKNCYYSETRAEFYNFKSLLYFYRVGAFLEYIKSKLDNLDDYKKSERSLISGLIKGSGIASLYTNNGIFGTNEQKSARVFYHKATRVYSIYRNFPHPLRQILCSSGEVTANKLFKIGNTIEFNNLNSELKREIANNFSVYDNIYIDLKLFGIVDEGNLFNYNLITEEILNDVKFFINNPRVPYPKSLNFR